MDGWIGRKGGIDEDTWVSEGSLEAKEGKDG